MCIDRRHHAAAFTLVETLAAGLILAISAVAIGTGVRQSIRAAELARDYQKAAEILDDLATRIDLIGPDRVLREGPLQGRAKAPDDRFVWQASVVPLIDNYLFSIDVTVTWTDGAGVHSAVLSTYINDPPGSRNPALRWSDL